ncbi:SDR family NAD(P)-dependent oxidoreductase [Paeniroseomonas aquatica]|uniref:SDR family NAD(P)-dependent oxidoreductase n=1 Tax=Paeniroseomonas aquatica TaxID=373043 RepID=UPI003608DCF1
MSEGMLRGKVALVTGGSRGIGRAIALAFAEAGADVAICHLGDAERAATLVQAVTARGRHGFAAECDVADPAATRAFAAAAEAALGPCDILVNNAGINLRGPFEGVTEEVYDRVIDVHVKGMFFMAQAVYAGMVARGRGKIINLASQLALKGGPDITPYGTAKGAIIGFTRISPGRRRRRASR